MDSQMFPMSEEERETTLESMRKELSEICIEIEEHLEAKKAYIKQLNDKLKPLKDRKKKILSNMRRLT